MSTTDPNILNAMRNIAAMRKTTFPWTRDEPYTQPYYTYSAGEGAWLPPTDSSPSSQSKPTTSRNVTLITWNIDFMLPLTSERMSAAITYLQSLVSSSTSPVVIFLQEMLTSDLQLLQDAQWVRQNFYITDLNSKYWESGYYGTCTLISKHLPIKDVFRVHYSATKFERDGLFVDVDLSGKAVRFCNTHLESLIADPPLRPAQIAMAAKYMHDSSVHASIAAGDFNAIQPFDRTLHSDNDLKDAYLELGGKEDAEEGYTWGQQAQTKLREMFGCSRMDKVFYCGELRVDGLETIGVDVEVEEEGHKEMLKSQGLDRAWVTDHLGLKAELLIVDKAEAENNAPHL